MGKFNLQTTKKRVSNSPEDPTGTGTDGAPEVPDVGIETVDGLEVKLHEFSDHMSKNLPKYVIAAILLALVGAGVSWWFSSRTTKNAEKTDALSAGVAAIHAPTKETLESEGAILDLLSQQDPNADKNKKKAEPSFATDAEKWTAALAAAEKAKAELSDTHAVLASGVVARAQLGAGKAADAAKGFGELAAAPAAQSFQGVALESQGNAAWTAGDAAGAAAAYEKLAALDDLYYKVRGAMLLGDLQNPSMGGKDAAKAKGHYEKALELLKPAEGQVFTQALRTLRGEISRRRAQL